MSEDDLNDDYPESDDIESMEFDDDLEDIAELPTADIEEE